MAPGELPRGVAVEKTPVGNDEAGRRSGRGRRMRPPSVMAEHEGEKGANGSGETGRRGGGALAGNFSTSVKPRCSLRPEACFELGVPFR
jgi:hypothetical protein